MAAAYQPPVIYKAVVDFLCLNTDLGRYADALVSYTPRIGSRFNLKLWLWSGTEGAQCPGGANVVHRAPAGDKARVACRSMEVAPVTSERSRRRGRPASASRRR